MADAVLGLGTIVKADYTADDGSTFVAVGEVTSFTPPGRSRRTLDVSTLASTLAINAARIEDFSEMTFVQRWDPDDAAHLLVDTDFGNSNTAVYQLLFVNTGATTWTFSGWITNLSAETVDVDGILSRTVTVRRTTAITVA